MSEPADETLNKIEQTQAALRDSIAKVKELASQSERLIRQHREETTEPKPPNPAG